MQANRSAFHRITRLITDIIFGGLLLLLAFVLLIAYGVGEFPKRFQARVPMTNMRDVERILGRPVSISPYSDGIICWDYTHWWSGTAKVYFKTNGDYYRTFTEF